MEVGILKPIKHFDLSFEEEREEGKEEVWVWEEDLVYLDKEEMRRQRARRVVRHISYEPRWNFFKPAGIPARELEEIVLLLEEYEAMRLADIENLSMQQAAERMKVSAPTFNRMLKMAHQKFAHALIEGKAIRVQLEGEGN
ncbi:MAG: DUF134 domain-containing protein [bacterium]|nr:DUF134 domain-containing protein [bacterium]